VASAQRAVAGTDESTYRARSYAAAAGQSAKRALSMLEFKRSTHPEVPVPACDGQAFVLSIALLVSGLAFACGDVQCPPGTRLDGAYCRRIVADSEQAGGAGVGLTAPPPVSGAMGNPMMMNAGGKTADPNPTAGAAPSSTVAGSSGMRGSAADAGAPDAGARGNVGASGHTAFDAGTGQRGTMGGAGGTPGSGAGGGGSDLSACAMNVCTPDYPCQPLGANYTCRGQFADWPPAYYSSAFTLNSDGTIKDSRSGLIWQATVPSSYAPACSEKSSSSGTNGDSCNWQHAKDYCAGLSLAAGGWRLPTKAELESLVDDSRNNPAIDPAFVGTPPEIFWSSSAYAGSSGGAYYVDFGRAASYYNDTSNARRVRCVHSVAPVAVASGSGGAPPSRYTFPATGTVHDTRTNLTWQRAVDADSYTQSAAASYCTGLTLANGGWRLPTRSELLTLVDPTKSNPAIDTTAFPSVPIAPLDSFWSSSADAGSPGIAWFVHFNTGCPSYTDFRELYLVRCVR
jgi:hypothetical protein